MQQADTQLAKRLFKVQAALGVIAAVIALPFGGLVTLSVLVGAGVCLLANRLFALWVFRSYRAQQPQRLLLRIYGAEAAKLALIIGLFGLAFVAIDGLNIPALLAAYLVIQVASTLIAAQFGGPTGRPRQG
jgi:ATP synthase protein I